jgi:DNA-binding PadR family transcriptional regulator
MKNELLESWEATYKKGQLSLWILLALKEGPKYLPEIQDFIREASRDSISCEDQSLYRALRKFTVVEMVQFDLHKGDRGPDKKHYALTDLGTEILDAFTQRNIKPFFTTRLQNLMNLNS